MWLAQRSPGSHSAYLGHRFVFHAVVTRGHLLKASHRKDSLASKQLHPFTRPVIPMLMDRGQVTSLPSISPVWPSWGKCPIVAEREQTTGQLPEDSCPSLNKTGAVPLVMELTFCSRSSREQVDTQPTRCCERILCCGEYTTGQRTESEGGIALNWVVRRGLSRHDL